LLCSIQLTECNCDESSNECRNPDCTRFAWNNHEDGTCWLKNGQGDAFYSGHGGSCGYVTAEKNVVYGVSWVIADQGRIRWSHHCDMSGETIEVRRTSGDQCGAACLSRHDCIGFAWKNDNCWLKSPGYPIIDYTNTGGVCGEVIGRSSYSASSTGRSDGLRKSERACNDFTEIASHYRIVSGDLAQRNDFPWMAAFYYPEDENDIMKNLEFRCGGTIISDYYILTAAHCLDGIEPSIVRLGTHILNHSKKTDLRVESCTKHPNFMFDTRKNDIGLVKVRERITFNMKILPACLRKDLNDLPQNKVLLVTGWGYDGENIVSNFLRKISLVTVDIQRCKADYSKHGSEHRNQIDNGQYCAQDQNNQHDACGGDSGGPLQIIESKLATVVGVVSWGADCDGSTPGIYSRVAYYLDWIEDVVWGN
ncbi:Serine protease Hayan, partial [Pseudolycoriella hygida]